MSDHSQDFETRVFAVDPNNLAEGVMGALREVVIEQSGEAMQELLKAIDHDAYAKLEQDTFAFLNQRSPKVCENVFLAASLAANMIASNPLGHPDPDSFGVMVRLASFIRIVHSLVNRIQEDARAEAAKAAAGAEGVTRN